MKNLVAVPVIALAASILPAASAQAATSPIVVKRSCFTNQIQGSVKFVYVPSSRYYGQIIVRRIQYRIIDHGKIGNTSDIYANDGSTQPMQVGSTQNAISNGRWHTLREADYYSNSNRRKSVLFKFDRRWPKSNVECGVSTPLKKR